MDEVYQRVMKGSEWLQECISEKSVLLTGIMRFDELFLPGLESGQIVEVLGAPESGKTMLLNTIMLNVLEETYQSEDYQVMFIDTKFDFQAIKLKTIMDYRGIPFTKQSKIYKRVLVQRVRTLEELVLALKFVADTPVEHKKVKIVMIDSITVLYYLYLGRQRFILSLLTKVADLMKVLSLRNITVFVTNLAINIREPSLLPSQRTQSSSEGAELIAAPKLPEVKAAIGKYWETVAHHKVLIDFVDYPHQFKQDRTNNVRHISLFHSKTFPSSAPTKVQITKLGIS